MKYVSFETFLFLAQVMICMALESKTTFQGVFHLHELKFARNSKMLFFEYFVLIWAARAADLYYL